MNSLFDASIMLSLQDKALNIKLFYKNDQTVTDTLRKLRTAKRLKKTKKKNQFSIRDTESCEEIKETGRLEDRPRSGRPSLWKGRVAAVENVMENMAA